MLLSLSLAACSTVRQAGEAFSLARPMEAGPPQLPTPAALTLTPGRSASPTPAPTTTPFRPPTETPTPSATPTHPPAPTLTATPLALERLPVIALEDVRRLQRIGWIPAAGAGGVQAAGFAFSPDGRLLALDGGLAVRIWSVREGNWIAELAPPAPGYAPGGALAFSPDGLQIARVYRLNRIVIWSVESGEVVRELSGGPGTQAFNALAYSPPGSAQPRLVASGVGPDGPQLIFWDATSGDLLAESPTGGREVGSFRISPIGRLVLQAGHEGVLRFWDLQTGNRISQQYLYACPDALTGAAFTRSGGLLALQCAGASPNDPPGAIQARIYFYEPNYYRPDDLNLFTLLNSEQPGSGPMVFNRTGGLLVMASGAPARQLTVWSFYDRHPVLTLADFASDIRQVEFSPDGRLLVAQMADGALELWGAPAATP